MTESEQIDANSIAEGRTSVFEVLVYILKHPIETLVVRWNWKAAVLSSLLRAPIFFFTYLFKKDGLKLAIGAAVAQSVFRFIFKSPNGLLEVRHETALDETRDDCL